jgi:hypothetical protein
VNDRGTSCTSPEQAVQEGLRTIELLFKPGEGVEIRALAVGRIPGNPGSTYAGYFNGENRAPRTVYRSPRARAIGPSNSYLDAAEMVRSGWPARQRCGIEGKLAITWRSR